MGQKTLTQIVAEQPFADFAKWWSMGVDFLSFMAEAIVSEWKTLPGNAGDLAPVKSYATEYLRVVFQRDAGVGLVDDFVNQSFTHQQFSV